MSWRVMQTSIPRWAESLCLTPFSSCWLRLFSPQAHAATSV